MPQNQELEGFNSACLLLLETCVRCIPTYHRILKEPTKKRGLGFVLHGPFGGPHRVASYDTSNSATQGVQDTEASKALNRILWVFEPEPTNTVEARKLEYDPLIPKPKKTKSS